MIMSSRFVAPADCHRPRAENPRAGGQSAETFDELVVEILVAERNPKHPLTHQGRDLVLDPFRTPVVVKAQRKTIYKLNRPDGRSQQQRSRIRRDQSGINAASAERPSTVPKSNPSALTLCRHRGSPQIYGVVAAQQLSLIRSPRCAHLREKSRLGPSLRRPQ